MNTERKLKRGDVREDGRLFWKYQPQAKNGEYWVTKEKFDKFQSDKKARDSKWLAKNPDKVKLQRLRFHLKYKESKIREKNKRMQQRRRSQSAADQFFIMAGAAESISQLK